jgi:hypothetical protein
MRRITFYRMGLAIPEVLVMLSGICLLSLIAVAGCARQRQASCAGVCINNLRLLDSASAQFLQERHKWITSVSTNEGGTLELASDPTSAYWHFRALLGRQSFQLRCPLDKRTGRTPTLSLNTNLSYFVTLNLPTDGSSWVVGGCRNFTTQEEAIVPLKSSDSLAWHGQFGMHGRQGYSLLWPTQGIVFTVRLPTDNVPAARTDYVVLP